ncbi:MAG: IS1 family transposase [Spirulina sp. DLM2.Bin59]|nr:MAG: IS1 family transposase [Spirulina sp. DLM2.Bin59]
MPHCPDCDSKRTVKNGHIHTGKQRYLCRNCGRQFVKNPTNKVIDTPTRERTKTMLKQIPHIAHHSMNGSSGHHRGTHEQRATLGRALAAFEIAVRRRSTDLIPLELVRVHGQTHRTARFPPFKPGGLENRI